MAPSPDRAQEQQFPCDISFDHLGKVGKPLMSTMKLDEFLKNVISVEEGHLLQNVNPSSSSSSCSSSSSASPLFLGDFELNNNGTLSKKPANDIWKDINDNQQEVNVMDHQSIQRLGETSLEDFLVRAGVINVGNQNAVLNPHHQPIMAIDPTVVVSQQADWLQLQMAAAQQDQQQQQQQMSTVLVSDFHVSESVYENPVVDVGYSDNQLAMTMPMPATSSESQAVAEKKRRYSDEMMEKTIERRQKRMIKNRESAARSRAKKQAYTNKLEHEVLQLQKTNSWLKKLKEQEMILSSNPIPTPGYQLRRTSSSSF